MLRRLVLLVAAAAAGCGGDGSGTYPVSGTVTVAGRPAAGALVLFHPQGDKSQFANKPYATVKDDGTFVLTTYSDKPDGGAPAGEYKVTVWWPGKPKAAEKGAAITMGSSEKADGAGEDRLKGKYNNAAATPLKATVKAETNNLPPFEL